MKGAGEEEGRLEERREEGEKTMDVREGKRQKTFEMGGGGGGEDGVKTVEGRCRRKKNYGGEEEGKKRMLFSFLMQFSDLLALYGV